MTATPSAGVTIANHGDFADPSLLADLAVAAEESGWDGAFVWDHVARAGQPPMTDPWIALAAIATRTHRVRIGPMVTPLPRRRPWKLAREVTALDHLSAGRVVLGVGLGVHPEEFDAVGEETDLRRRADSLDEAIDLLRAFWSGEAVHHDGPTWRVDGLVHTPTPVQAQIPIWVAGRWPNQRPMRRAARHQGAVPIHVDGPLSPEGLAEVRAYIDAHRDDPDAPYDVAVEGLTTAHDAGEIVTGYAEAGMTWWLERIRPEDTSPAEALARIAAGPPRPPAPGM